MKKNSFFEDFLRPILTMIAICTVAAALLGYVNSLTEPIIYQNTNAKADATRKAVLEGSTTFTKVDCDEDALGITSCYKEDSGLGYVMTASYKGYAGDVVVTVGLDNEGKIVGIDADCSTETTGVGSKAGETSYLEKYMGLSGHADVDTIASATFSSTAVKTGVNAILAAFDAVK